MSNIDLNSEDNARRLIAGLRRPIVAQPMAGGPSTPELVSAVWQAGGLGFLGAGYQTPDSLQQQIEQLATSGVSYGINLFAETSGEPARPQLSESEVAAAVQGWASELQADAARVDVTLTADAALRSCTDTVKTAEKLAVILQVLAAGRGPAAVSFTFGLPAAADVRALQQAGTTVWQTVTSAEEAELALALGVDGLVVQGPAAGGHSGAFINPPQESSDAAQPGVPGVAGTVDAVRGVREAVGYEVPVIAAGGVQGATCVRKLLAAGADAVGCGTLFLTATEAGTAPSYRQALTSETHRESGTRITRAFSGKPARALATDFVARHKGAPALFPEIHLLTGPMRAAAQKAGDPELQALWAGSGYTACREDTAESIIRGLSI